MNPVLSASISHFLRNPVIYVKHESSENVRALQAENEKLRAELHKTQSMLAREFAINQQYEDEKRSIKK